MVTPTFSDIGADYQPDLTGLKQVFKILNTRTPEWLKSGQVNIRFVDDATIRGLNKTYSGKDQATDVLAFNYSENGQPEDGELGDIAVSIDTAKRQAAAAGTTLADEVALLGLHGILHLHGFDHAQPADQTAMDQLQADVLQSAGVTYRDFKWA